MTIAERLIKCDQDFEAVKAQREEQVGIINDATTKAKDLWDEMMRLQGEYRVLKDLAEEKPNKEATVIVAVPEEK